MTRVRSAALRPSKSSPSRSSRTHSGIPPRCGASTRHPPGQTFRGHERRAVPPHRRHDGGVDLGEQGGEVVGPERAADLDDPARVHPLQAFGELRRDLAVDRHADVGGRALRGLDEQLRALVRVGRAEEPEVQRAAGDGAPTHPLAPQLVPHGLGGGHRLADDVDHLVRVAGADERALHGVGDRETDAHPAREPGADLAQAHLVAGAVAAADARRAVPTAVARPRTQLELAREQVVARADQPVVVGREVRRQPARERLVDQRGAEVVQVVEVHDVGLHAVEQRTERRRDRRVVDLAVRVAEVEQPVGAVEDAHELHALVDATPRSRTASPSRPGRRPRRRP